MMNQRPDHPFDRAELDASLQRLGVQELEERLEVSTLLVGAGEADPANASVCCSCKMPPDFLGKDPTLPYPSIAPAPDTSNIPSGPL